MSQSLLSWFEKRRKNKTLELSKNQIMKSLNTVTELEKSIQAFSNNDTFKAEKAIERLFKEEVEIDGLRRTIFSELTKGTLPKKYREDLKGLIGRLDRLADFIKDAARSIQILLNFKKKIPKDIMTMIINMAKTLMECTIFLSTSIEMLGINSPQAIEFAKKVDEAEGRIDDYHLKAKVLFFEYVKKLDTSTFLVLKDLIDAIESAADMCADTADFIRVLASGEI